MQIEAITECLIIFSGSFFCVATTVVHTNYSSTLSRFYSYDYDLRKMNYIFKWLYFKEIER